MKLVRHAAAALMAAALILPTATVAHADEATTAPTPKTIAEMRAEFKKLVDELNTQTCADFDKELGYMYNPKNPGPGVSKEYLAMLGLPPEQFRKETQKYLNAEFDIAKHKASNPDWKSWSDKDIREALNLELEAHLLGYTKAYNCGLVEKKNTPAPQNPAPKPDTGTNQGDNNQGNNTKPPAGLGKSQGSGGSSFSS